ncbi:MAG: NUDIX hydrolase [Acidimicrobiales bacterium]
MTGDGSFRRLDEDVHWTGHIVSVATGRFAAPDGTTFQRDVVHHPGAVGVVPLTDDGDVVLVRQYRAVLDSWLLEIPAGLRDVDGESTEQTAARELAEEVGLRADTYELLCRFHNSPGCTDEEVVVYLATGLEVTASDAQGVEEEHLDVIRVPLADALAQVHEGAITDAKTVIGLLLAAAR